MLFRLCRESIDNMIVADSTDSKGKNITTDPLLAYYKKGKALQALNPQVDCGDWIKGRGKEIGKLKGKGKKKK